MATSPKTRTRTSSTAIVSTLRSVARNVWSMTCCLVKTRPEGIRDGPIGCQQRLDEAAIAGDPRLRKSLLEIKDYGNVVSRSVNHGVRSRPTYLTGRSHVQPRIAEMPIRTAAAPTAWSQSSGRSRRNRTDR